MLSFIIPSFLFAASIQIESSDLTWIKDITHNMEKVSQSCQSEARAIVKNATKAAKNPQNCVLAQELATQGKEIGRKSLKSRGSKSLEVKPLETRESRYPQLLVFVSFSMPMATLKALARDVNRVGGKLVLRGLVKGSLPAGSFSETLIKLQELQEEIIIDPTLFEAYQIEVVPTFVLREQPTENAEEKVKHDVLRGNVSLEFALEQFTENGDVKGTAKQLLQNLRNKR